MAKSKYKDAHFTRVKKGFLKDVVTTVEMEAISAELILNWDQTAVKIVPTCTWTMERKGSNRVKVAGANDKCAITAVFAALCWVIFCRCKSSTKKKQLDAIHVTNSQLTGTSHTQLSIGPPRTLCCNTSIKAHTC